MGTDNLFYKHNKERIKRKENIKQQKSNTWLVVCEGTKTEPNYFKRAVEIINKQLDDDYKLKVEFVGLGKNTVSLVKSVDNIERTIDKYKLKTIPYGKIFVVFDKDDFDADLFNNAIKMCEENGYIPLWSNQAIEFWFLLHFNYIDSKIDRNLYKEKLEEYFKNNGYRYKYKKNDNKIYDKLIKYGSLDNAIKNARKIYNNHINDLPSDAESCTTVYNFFDEVNDRLNELK